MKLLKNSNKYTPLIESCRALPLSEEKSGHQMSFTVLSEQKQKFQRGVQTLCAGVDKSQGNYLVTINHCRENIAFLNVLNMPLHFVLIYLRQKYIFHVGLWVSATSQLSLRYISQSNVFQHYLHISHSG